MYNTQLALLDSVSVEKRLYRFDKRRAETEKKQVMCSVFVECCASFVAWYVRTYMIKIGSTKNTHAIWWCLFDFSNGTTHSFARSWRRPVKYHWNLWHFSLNAAHFLALFTQFDNNGNNSDKHTKYARTFWYFGEQLFRKNFYFLNVNVDFSVVLSA